MNKKRSPWQASTGQARSKGRAVTSREPGKQHSRRRHRSKCRKAGREHQILNRLLSAHIARTRSQEATRRKQRDRHRSRHSCERHAHKVCQIVHSCPRRKMRDHPRKTDSSAESCRGCVSRYKVVSRPGRHGQLRSVSSRCSASRRHRSKHDACGDSSRSGRQQHRHKNSSCNRTPGDSSASNSSIGSHCCRYRDRSPLQSPLKSLLCPRRDSTMRCASGSKQGCAHCTHRDGASRSKNRENVSCSDQVNEVKRKRKKRHRRCSSCSVSDEDHGGFFPCLIM